MGARELNTIAPFFTRFKQNCARLGPRYYQSCTTTLDCCYLPKNQTDGSSKGEGNHLPHHNKPNDQDLAALGVVQKQ